jgi:hypothetical protein
MSHRRCAGSCDRREINRLHLPAPTAIAIQANDNLPSTRCRLPVTSRASVQRSTVRRSRRSVPGRLRTSWLRPAAMPDARVASAFAAHGSSLQPLQPISRRHHRDASNPGPRWSHPRGRPRTSWGMAACAFARRPVTAAAGLSPIFLELPFDHGASRAGSTSITHGTRSSVLVFSPMEPPA